MTLHRPTTQEDVSRLLVDLGPTARLHAGGTDIVVQMRAGSIEVDHLVDLSHVKGLDQIEHHTNGSMTIGANVTMVGLIADTNLCIRYPALVDAATLVGSRQIQSRATLVGNICNASPAADTVGPLLVHDADVVVVGQGGDRVVPIEQFVLGPRRTVLRAGEWVQSVRLPAATRGASAYEKLGRTLGIDVALVGVACRADNQTVALAMSSVAATVIRTPIAERLLLDQGRFTPEVAASISREIHPIDDVRASASYRRRVAPKLAERAWNRANERRRQDV